MTGEVWCCNECDKYFTRDKLEYCKSLNHHIFLDKQKLDAELERNWWVLKRTSSNTQQKNQLGKRLTN